MTPTHRAMVVATIARDFPLEDPDTVLALLDLYGVEPHEPERERVQLAILKLSGGDTDKLLHFIHAAKVDYRDVLWWSDMPSLSEL